MRPWFLRLYFTETDWIGPGKIELLERIRDTGSISAAGRSMKMSYRRAWLLVDALNRMFAGPLVEKHMGGVRGGSAALTELGVRVVKRYRSIEKKSQRASAADLADLRRLARRE